MSAILEIHIRRIEQAYVAALERALTRLEEYQEKRIKAIQEALQDMDIEQERQKIRQIMAEIQAKNSASRKGR